MTTRELLPLDAAPDLVIPLPGSRSITNRALVAAGLADGTSTIRGALRADDTEAMVETWRRLGVSIDVSDETDGPGVTLVVTGAGGTLPAASVDLDARLSGTTSRFALALTMIGDGRYHIDGAPPLRARPMGDGIDVLRTIGLTVDELGEPGHLPVAVYGGPAAPPSVDVPGGMSSQFLSGFALAAPCLAGTSRWTVRGTLVSAPYVEMTRAVMGSFGARTRWEGATLVVDGTGYRGADYVVEPDAATASYLFAAAAITGGRVEVPGLRRRSIQGDLRVVDILAEMGAEVTETASGLAVAGTGALRGITVDMADCSDMAQTVAAVAVWADGPTEITGIGFIRGKETDRVGNVVAELVRLGIAARETADGYVIEPGTPAPGTVATHDDHRMAMSLALLGLRAPGIRIADAEVVAKTAPGYWELLDRLRTDGRAVSRVSVP